MTKLILKTLDTQTNEIIELTYPLENIEFEYAEGELVTCFAEVQPNGDMVYRKYKNKKIDNEQGNLFDKENKS